jgi:hypothetical protein
MHCHSLACGTVNRTQSATQSGTLSIAAAPHDAVIRVYDEAGNVIETHEQAGDSKHWRVLFSGVGQSARL